jgi:hypothetical protein
MLYDVTKSAPTFAQEYAELKKQCDDATISAADRMRLLDIMTALKLGYLYGRAEMGTEMTAILKGPQVTDERTPTAPFS